ncbi:hypothetical protein DSO57_1025576 [Entomophthora muscae]|uniref:Uncharacterized protein n=1 Tax=Entomophthora muscae TaxID=34485 RepID=A0ACC2SFA2_9FUNG|nr:hypothetical protein DSO57_1025576 [Entomophthora muscae]
MPLYHQQVPQPQKCLSSHSKNDNQIGTDLIKPAASSTKTNCQSSKDRPPASQAAIPEDPKNDYKTANQPEKLEMPNLVTQIAPEECQEAPAYE